ncbi:TIGR02186 family protein, partial [Oceanidesulfovibrio marinus]
MMTKPSRLPWARSRTACNRSRPRCPFPPSWPQATLASLAVKDGPEFAMTEKDLKVELVSTPLFMAKLAFGHGALYGILATIIALVSGLVIGLIFPSKGEGH